MASDPREATPTIGKIQGLGGDVVIALAALFAIIMTVVYLAVEALRAFSKWLFVD